MNDERGASLSAAHGWHLPVAKTANAEPPFRQLGGLGVLRGVFEAARRTRGPVALCPRFSPGLPLPLVRRSVNYHCIRRVSSGCVHNRRILIQQSATPTDTTVA